MNVLSNKFTNPILPTLEKSEASPPTSRINIPEDANTLPLIDKQQFGRKRLVESAGTYTLRLGVFHDLGRAKLEESEMYLTMSTGAACEQQIVATFYIPEAQARFVDGLILNAPHPFTISIIPGSPILERHSDSHFGLPIRYDLTTNGDTITLLRTGLRKNVSDLYKIGFDVLSIQVKITFEQ